MILGDNKMMVIGSHLSFYYDFLMKNWTPGPNLKISRHSHACGKIKVKDEPMIITVCFVLFYLPLSSSTHRGLVMNFKR